jgi:hypothetical protein
VLVLLQTQTSCASAAGVAGSWFAKETSERPLIWTRFGTDAPIEIDPVDVVPRLPCVAAKAVPFAMSAAMQAAGRLKNRAFMSLSLTVMGRDPSVLDVTGTP